MDPGVVTELVADPERQERPRRRPRPGASPGGSPPTSSRVPSYFRRSSDRSSRAAIRLATAGITMYVSAQPVCRIWRNGLLTTL